MRIGTAPSGELRATVELSLAEGREERVLFGESCATLADAALLVISMAFDDEPEDAAQAVTEARRPHAEKLTPDPTPEQRAPLHVGLGAIAQIDHGALPAMSAGAGGSLALARARLWLELRGTYWAKRSANPLNESGAGGEFGLATGSARTCYLALGERALSGGANLGPCLSLELGAATGRGRGLETQEERRGLWAAGLLGAVLVLGPYAHLVPLAQIEFGATLRRPSFEISELGTVFQARALVFRASLGLLFML